MGALPHASSFLVEARPTIRASIGLPYLALLAQNSLETSRATAGIFIVIQFSILNKSQFSKKAYQPREIMSTIALPYLSADITERLTYCGLDDMHGAARQAAWLSVWLRVNLAFRLTVYPIVYLTSIARSTC